MATIIVGVGNTHTVADTQPTSTSGSGTPWTGTVDFGSVPSGLESGDLMTDNSARTYMVQSIDDADTISVIANQAESSAPDTAGNASFDRAFTSVASAEAAISTWAASGDTYTIECHSEGSMPLSEASVTFNDTTLGTSGTLKLTVKDDEWHEGTPGGGFRFQNNSDTDAFNFGVTEASCPTQVIERLEIVGNTITDGGTVKGLDIIEDGASTQATTIRNVIIHGHTAAAPSGGTMYGIHVANGADNGVVVENALVYGFTRSSGSAQVRAIFIQGDNATFSNCTVYNNIASNAQCFQANASSVHPVMKNCVGIDAQVDFNGTYNTASTNNGSGDTTAPDNGGANPSQENLTATDEWTDPASGDFTIKNASAALFDNGTDLSGTFTDDITGSTRTGTWDIGAFALAAAGALVKRSGHGDLGIFRQMTRV